MNVKSLRSVVFVAGIVASLNVLFAGSVYYVNPDPAVGNDSYDGKAEVWDGEHGPWHTLAGAMTNKLNSGDIVIALPGWYDEGVSNPEVKDTGDPFIRVTVPNGVTLKSRDGAATTFIVGANSTEPDAKGHGINATRCVYLGGAKSRVEGFTICNGRTFSGTGSSGTNGRNTGGGVYGNASAVVVDCVISNCYAAYRGGAAYYAGVFHRCRFVKNDAGNGGSGNAVKMYNCYMADAQSYQCALYNCVCAKDGFPRGASAYNTILLTSGSSSNGSPKFYNCYYNVNLSSDCVTNGTCVKTTTAALALDADGRPQKGSIVINAANPAYVANIPAAFRDLDLGRGQRVYDGVADVGCYEYDPRGDYTDALCAQDGAMEVTAATPMVIGAENSVSIGTNQTLAVTLLKNGDAATTAWAFYATVEGSGTINVQGGNPLYSGDTCAGGGGGGRIALTWSDSAGQQTYSPALAFNCAGSIGHVPCSNSGFGEAGTLYLTDASFFPGTVCKGGGRVTYATPPTSLTLDSLTVNTATLEFEQQFPITIIGDLTVNKPGDFIIRGGTVTVGGDVLVRGASSAVGHVCCRRMRPIRRNGFSGRSFGRKCKSRFIRWRKSNI